MTEENNAVTAGRTPSLRPKCPIETIVLGILVAFLPGDAQAYIDPGSGALLVQAVLSGIFGAIFLARKTLRQVALRFFGPKVPAPPSKDPESPSKNDVIGR